MTLTKAQVYMILKQNDIINDDSGRYHKLSRLQTSKFSMTSFYVTSFICSSLHATLTIRTTEITIVSVVLYVIKNHVIYINFAQDFSFDFLGDNAYS